MRGYRSITFLSAEISHDKINGQRRSIDRSLLDDKICALIKCAQLGDLSGFYDRGEFFFFREDDIAGGEVEKRMCLGKYCIMTDLSIMELIMVYEYDKLIEEKVIGIFALFHGESNFGLVFGGSIERKRETLFVEEKKHCVPME